MKVQLTDRFCQHAKSLGEAQTDYFDETVPGLALRVTSKGVKAWTLLYGIPRRRMTLGRYPSLSLVRARTLAIETKEGRTQGTVAALAEVYIKSKGTYRSAKEIERRLRKDVLPIIGHIPLRELHRRDITRVLDSKSAAPIAARRAFEDMRAMVRWAVSRGDLDHNPIEGMKGPANSNARQRVLSDKEIRALWQGLEAFSPCCQQVLKLCLVTAQRLGEVTGLERSELDLERRLWNIPGSRTKNGHAHSVPLSPLAIEIIEAGTKGNRAFPIKAVSVSQVINGTQLGLPHWTAHDLRRTALTGMAKLGVAPIVLGHVANHRTTTKAGMTLSVYVHHAYEKEKRAALELWADRLQGIIAGGADVVSIGSKR
jgi:integrase